MNCTILSGALLLCVFALVSSENIFEALRRNTELSKFYEMVKKDETVQILLSRKTVTLFAPTNSAVDRADPRIRNIEDKVASYHMLIQLADKSVFPSSVSSFLSGAAPLYLSTQVSDTDNSDKSYFVNNAKIDKEMEYSADDGSKQMLYIIDELLEPYVPSNNHAPNAYQFLNQPSVYNVQESVGAFAAKVRSENQGSEFERTGTHTFFLPIGIGDSENLNRLREIDPSVIRGHVIPDHVLFTRTMGTKTYMTSSYTPNMKVEISIVNSTINTPGEGEGFSRKPTESNPNFVKGDGFTLKIKSNTLQSDHRHKKGVVLSKLVRGNIPVKNGVVHLIEAPLMIIDTNVYTFIRNEADGRLSEFFTLMNHAPDFRFVVQSQAEKTLFVPNNDAIKRLSEEKIKELKSNISAVTNLLNLHIVMGSVSSDDVKTERITELMSADKRRKLYFRVLGDERNRTLIVQGGGVNANAVQADIGATDGIIHIIDRVLGQPYLTVYETLKETESDLNETYQLSKQDEWNLPLAEKDKKFTFFAPSDSAWGEMAKEMPTAYKQLKMGLYPQHTNKILDRHLLVGRELSTKALEKEDSIQLINGVFKIEKGYSSDQLYVVWEGYRALIIRPDVQATNGVIHIIDKVMMKSRDLIKSSTTVPASSLAMTLVSTVLMLIAVNKL